MTCLLASSLHLVCEGSRTCVLREVGENTDNQIVGQTYHWGVERSLGGLLIVCMEIRRPYDCTKLLSDEGELAADAK